MTIEVQCPGCGREHRFPDRKRGERVRCSKCDRSFIADESSPEQEDSPRHRRSRDSGAFPIIPVGVAAYMVVASLGVGVWAFSHDRPADPGPPLPPGIVNPGPGGNQGGNPGNNAGGNRGGNPGENPLPLDKQSVDVLLARLQNRNPQAPWERHQAAEELGRRREPRAIAPTARMLIDGGDRGPAANALRSHGKAAERHVLPLMHHPDGGTRETARGLLRDYQTSDATLIAQTLNDLNTPDLNRTLAALEWLADKPPLPARSADVARAQERLLSHADGRVRENAMKGLKNWGTKANTPAVARFLQDNVKSAFGSQTHHWAFEALTAWKDARGAAAAVLYLPDPFLNGEAIKALQAMGPDAASEVARAVNHPDGGARERARQLLQGYGVGDTILLDRSLADLKDPDAGKRRQTLEGLAQVKPDAARRGEVAKAIGPLLKDTDQGVRDVALRATKTWLDRESVPFLITVLQDPNPGAIFMRGQAIELLGTLRDPRAADAVAARLPFTQERFAATKALKEIGGPAEEAVLRLLKDTDIGVKVEACRILEVIGTAKSIPALEAAEKDIVLMFPAKAALQAIRKRGQ